MKKCTKCKEIKDYTKFSKCSSAKDGYQWHCKECNNADNQRFRDEIDPEYMTRWFDKHRDKWNEYLTDYSSSNNINKVYTITSNITGKVYVGLTRRKLPAFRFNEHKKFYRWGVHKLPLLWKSFDMDGVENHTFEVIHQFEGTKREGMQMESRLIKFYKSINKSLNKQS